MSRSKWKGPSIVVEKKKYCLGVKRSTEITLRMVGLVLEVHNGRDLVLVEVTEDIVGRKAGEFVSTRSEFKFKKK